MADKNKEFREELLEAFSAEGYDQVANIAQSLLKLENSADEATSLPLIEKAYKELHNLKGSARGVQFSSIESFCHPLESILYALKIGKVKATPELVDLLLSSTNAVEQLFSEPDAPKLRPPVQKLLDKLLIAAKKVDDSIQIFSEETRDADDSEENFIIESMTLLEENDLDPLEETSPVRSSTGSLAETKQSHKYIASEVSRKNTGTVRIAAAKLDLVMQKSEEMLSIKLMAKQQAAETGVLESSFVGWSKKWQKAAPELKDLRRLTNKANLQSIEAERILHKINDLLQWNEDYIKSLSRQVRTLATSANACAHYASNSLDDLLDETKHLLMMPCSSQFNSFHLLVRDLARELGKEVDFSITGEEIEIDKRILSEIRDPLTHALRNSLDHGIEDPEERVIKGKNRRAKLTLSATQLDSGTIEIRVSDDGNGIDVQLIRERAIESGMHTADELAKMTPEAIRALIFKSSFSTRKLITEISGRGMGLSILEENVRRLGGQLKLESVPQQGTVIIMTIPVTISTFRGMLIDLMEKHFIIPTTSIDRVIRIRKSDIKPVEGLSTISLEGTHIPLYPLADILQLSESKQAKKLDTSEFLTVSILGSGESRVGVVVDNIIEELEVLVKPLGPVLAGTPNISGLSILGSGKVVPILNVTDILQHRQVGQVNYNDSTNVASPKSERKILVTDDTLTARMLLRNILETVGFTVKTANDGVEALEILENEVEPFDLLVTDLEMPNMNGFELTSAVRKSTKLQSLPVIMVTSKTAREEREKGVAVGANAYFIKSSFEQTNLIDVITSLIGR